MYDGNFCGTQANNSTLKIHELEKGFICDNV